MAHRQQRLKAPWRLSVETACKFVGAAKAEPANDGEDVEDAEDVEDVEDGEFDLMHDLRGIHHRVPTRRRT